MKKQFNSAQVVETIRDKGFPKTTKIKKRINDIFFELFFFQKQNDFLRRLIKENQEK